MNTPRFRLAPSAAAFVDGAKVQTDTAPDSSVQHNTVPWQDISAGTRGINFKPTPELYAMMTWCKNNVPGGISFLEILRLGAEAHCRTLIEKHYKPEE